MALKRQDVAFLQTLKTMINMCTTRGSIACTVGKPTGKRKFGHSVELKLYKRQEEDQG